MSLDAVIELGRSAILLSLLISAPVLIAAVVVSLGINVLQAVTQLQDQTLSFVPKIVVMMLALLFALPWILNTLIDYSTDLFRSIPAGL